MSKTMSLFLKYASENKDRTYNNCETHKFDPLSPQQTRLSLCIHAGVTGMHHTSWLPSLVLLSFYVLCLETS